MVYNLIRLADYLFRWTGDAAYADYIERNLYNGILAQQHPQTGMVAYYLPLEGGARKLWGSPTHDFWCCHGTLVQAQSIHNAHVYYQDDEGIMVAQYIPTELRADWNGVPVSISLQAANREADRHRPESWRFDLQVVCERPVEFSLKLRLPGWLSGAASISVNGEAEIPGSDGFAVIRRAWSKDTVMIDLPKALAAVPLPDAPNVAAFVDGPVVLAGLCDQDRTLVGDIHDASTLLEPHHEREWGNWLPNYRARDQARGLHFKPLYQVADERYTVYFTVKEQP